MSPSEPAGKAEPDLVHRRVAYEDSDGWVSALTGSGPAREQAIVSLHGLLLRVARSEVSRRRAAIGLEGPELDDLAHQAAADAVIAIVAKIRRLRGAGSGLGGAPGGGRRVDRAPAFDLRGPRPGRRAGGRARHRTGHHAQRPLQDSIRRPAYAAR